MQQMFLRYACLLPKLRGRSVTADGMAELFHHAVFSSSVALGMHKSPFLMIEVV